MTKKILLSFAIIFASTVIDMQAMRMRGEKKYQPSAADVAHKAIQQKFLELQIEVGIKPSLDDINKRYAAVQQKGVSQDTFNLIRSELNTLLSKEELTPADIKTITARMNDLLRLKPIRWPRSNDYQDVLNAKLAKGKAEEGGPEEAEEGEEIPEEAPKPTKEEEKLPKYSGIPQKDHFIIQKEFVELQKKYGVTTPDAEKRSVMPVKGRQGTQAQFNAVRSKLNNLLSQDVLSDDDIKVINGEIARLAGYRPARWPRTEDYKALLALRK